MLRSRREHRLPNDVHPHHTASEVIMSDRKSHPESGSEEIMELSRVSIDEDVQNEEGPKIDFVSLKQASFTVAAEDMIFLFKNTSEILSTCQWIFNGKSMGNSVDTKVIDVSEELNARDYLYSVKIPTLITTMEKIMEKTLDCSIDKKMMCTIVYHLFQTLASDMEKLINQLQNVFYLLKTGLSALRDMQSNCQAEAALRNCDVVGNSSADNSVANSSPFSWNSFAGKLKLYFCRRNFSPDRSKSFVDSAKLTVYRLGRGRKSLFQVYPGPELLFDREENRIVPTFQNIPKIDNNNTESRKIPNESRKDNLSLMTANINILEEKDYLNQDFYTVVQTSKYITIILQYKIDTMERNWKKCHIDKLGVWCGKDITEIVNTLKCCIESEYKGENTSDVSGLLRLVFKYGDICINHHKTLLQEFRQENDRLLRIQSKFLLI